jgi:hypothetical protein
MRNLLRIALSFGVLFIGVPAWRHSHAGGDRPHSHTHDRELDHCHETSGLEASHAHLHITLFGVEFTLPVEPQEDESDQGQSTLLVAAPTAMEPGQSPPHFIAVAQPTLRLGVPLQIVPSFRCITASAAPLCDTARHERSGVLLI